MIRSHPIAAALVLCVGWFAANAPRAAAQSSDAAFANPSRFMAQDGEALYRDVCQACHMPGGIGAVGAGAYPALAGDARLQSGGYALSLVLNGSKAMPGFGAMLDDRQAAAVVNYVRTDFGNDARDAVTEADAAAARK